MRSPSWSLPFFEPKAIRPAYLHPARIGVSTLLRGQGPLGFGAPSLVVQVKSGGIIADQPTLQSLLGSVTDAHADRGLLVSWGGFNSAVRQRVNELFFRVRVWDRAAFIAALLSVYEQLPEETRAALPLRRLWTVVPDERLDV
jgi:restriction system protein